MTAPAIKGFLATACATILTMGWGAAFPARELFPNSLVSISPSTRGFAVGDLNGDGLDDLALASYPYEVCDFLLGCSENPGTVSVRLATPNGSFTEAVGPGYSGGASDVVIGEFNHDGYADLAFAAFEGIFVYNGDGTGGFSFGALLYGQEERVEAWDFNGDGSSDLLVFSRFEEPPDLYLNDGRGGFGARVVAAFPAGGSLVSDLNGDARPDFLLSDPLSGELKAAYGVGDGSALPPVPLGVIAGPSASFEVSDLTADGVSDIIARTAAELRVFAGTGQGGFRAAHAVPIVGPGSLHVADFDSDARPDLLVVNSSRLPSILLAGRGDGTFAGPYVFNSGLPGGQVAVGRFDADSSLDLALLNGEEQLSILRGRAGGRFMGRLRLAVGDQPSLAAAADLNGDGRVDLITANSGSDDVSVLLAAEEGAFLPEARHPVGLRPVSIAIGDLNSDGNADLVVGNEGSVDFSILLGRGDGGLLSRAAVPSSGSTRSVDLCDFDADGRLDLAVAGGSTLLMGNGDGTFGAARPFDAGLSFNLLAADDFTGDGRCDLAVAGGRYVQRVCPPEEACFDVVIEGHLTLLKGAGDGTLTLDSRIDLGGPANTLGARDFDLNGRADLAVTTEEHEASCDDPFCPLVPGGGAIFLGRSDGAFDRVGLGAAEGVAAIAGGDFNGDGLGDAVLNDEQFAGRTSVLKAFVSTGERAFLRERDYLGIGRGIVAADFNGDGLEDLAGVDGAADAVTVLLGEPEGSGQPPVARAGTNQTLECQSPQGASLTLDGSASYDPDASPGGGGGLVSHEWFLDFGGSTQSLLGKGAQLPVSLPLGEHRVTLRVTDAEGRTATDEVDVAVQDTVAPALRITLSPDTLWPPNHRLAQVQANVTVTDLCEPAPMVMLQGVESSEPDDAQGPGDGSTSGDVQGTSPGEPDFDLILRAERASPGPGRTYTAIFASADRSGNVSTASANLFVPHDRGGVTEPLALSARNESAGTTLRWAAVPGATSYQVVRGEIGNLRARSGVHDLGPLVCLQAGTPATMLEAPDSSVPQPGAAFFYAASFSDGFDSSYGTEATALPRSPGPGTCP